MDLETNNRIPTFSRIMLCSNLKPGLSRSQPALLHHQSRKKKQETSLMKAMLFLDVTRDGCGTTSYCHILQSFRQLDNLISHSSTQSSCHFVNKKIRLFLVFSSIHSLHSQRKHLTISQVLPLSSVALEQEQIDLSREAST
jgi:hypothetical protein